jgi:peptide/nickel transport system substrate-binding protein
VRLYGKVGLAAIVAASLALSACGSSKNSNGSGKSNGDKSQASANLNDTNPLPYDQVASGGTLRWPIDSYPPQFNIEEIDGNEANINYLMFSTLPIVWHYDAGGKPYLNTDVVDKAEQTSTSPQTVELHINPKAVWSDGTPITWKEFQGIWQANSGKDKAYNIISSTGYEQIKSIEKGASDQDVKITFSTPFPDWKSLFTVLVPTTVTDTPQHFNKAWVNGPTVSGGPYKITSLDKTAKTITVSKNDKWWGKAPKLDKIQFVVLDQEAQAKALQSDQVDFVNIGSSVSSLALAKATQGVTIHKAGGPNWRHVDLGKSGFLSDVKVRQAVMLSLDREGDAKTLLSPLDWPAKVLDSHIWMNNQDQYKSSCGDFCNRDTAKAATLLEGAGFTKGADGFYAKNGKTLNLQFVISSGTKTQEDEAAIQQKALQQAGIKATIKPVPSDPYFPDYITPGKFDLAVFTWIGTPFPISSSKSIYTSNGAQNYSKIGTKEIDDLFTQVTQELDETKAKELSYQIDQKIWEEGHSAALYQRPDLIASKSNLVNFGAMGFADYVYEDIGFKK